MLRNPDPGKVSGAAAEKEDAPGSVLRGINLNIWVRKGVIILR
ncbi:MAG: hypothetical protein QME75_01420 [Deltaproteobacteria bacterium]|nr:hypothetical protein [Deltaproteobacteria bacterium]